MVSNYPQKPLAPTWLTASKWLLLVRMCRGRRYERLFVSTSLLQY